MQLEAFECAERVRKQADVDRRERQLDVELHEKVSALEAKHTSSLKERRTQLEGKHQREMDRLADEIERQHRVELDRKETELQASKDRAKAVAELEKSVRIHYLGTLYAQNILSICVYIAA